MALLEFQLMDSAGEKPHLAGTDKLLLFTSNPHY